MLHGEAAEIDDGDCSVDLGRLVPEDRVEEAGEGAEHVHLRVVLVGHVDGAWPDHEHPTTLVVHAGQQQQEPDNRRTVCYGRNLTTDGRCITGGT